MKLLRAVFFAVLFSLIVGFAIGTLIRLRYEKPERYIGALETLEPSVRLALAADPGHVLHSGALVLETRQGEEQVG